MVITATAMYDENSPFNVWADKWFLYKSVGISDGYKSAISSQVRYLSDYFGDTPVKEIRPMQICDMINELAVENPNTRRPSSKQLLKDIRCVASSIFSYVSANTNYDNNPAKVVTIPKDAPKNTRRALTEEEIGWLIDFDHKARLPALIMCFCGLRAGEMIPLLWSDIDFTNGEISVTKSVSRKTGGYKVKQGTKNGKKRKVRVPKSLLNELQTYRDNADSRYVCSKTDGNMHTVSSWRRLWDSYHTQLSHKYATVKQSKQNLYSPKGVKVKIEKITPHMLRHTFATLLYTSGVDVLSASKLLGHSNISITLEIYTHLKEERYIISIENYEEYIEERFF